MGVVKRFKTYWKIVVVITVIAFAFFILSRGLIYDRSELSYGVTFSHKQAIDLGLDWQEAYIAILDDLQVKNLRLSAYWDEIEKEPDTYSWDFLDWQIDEAEKRNVEVVLAVGARLPRWPECHYPFWTFELSEAQRQEKTLEYITKSVNRYKDREAIKYWQVENEPFLPNFGECPALDSKFLDKEVELVRSLDDREIMMTDSGELSLWVPAAKRADVFGTTMYLDTYSEALDSYIHYPIEPGFFHFKKNIARLFARPNKWIVIELQAEPWGPVPFQFLTEEERAITMDLEKFVEIIDFARKAGFREFYLWGAEWWYWEKTQRDNPDIWEEARKLYTVVD